MKKLGVIGGMGPEASAYYYDLVVRRTDAARDQDHIDLVMLSAASLPDRTYAIETGDDACLITGLIDCARTLERLGCKLIAIPCNTSHVFYERIQESTALSIIHMPRETVRYALGGARIGHENFDPARSRPPAPVRRIAIMATTGTLKAGIYAHECEVAGVTCIYPSSERQTDIMSLIYDDIKAGVQPDFAKFERAMDEFETVGADRVILACTELSVLARYRELPARCLDSIDVLVRESIVRCGAVYRDALTPADEIA